MFIMKALFIGRFQPFHKGHLKIIVNASRKYEEVIIGIGSSQYGNKSDNPFTAIERKNMIKSSLDKIDIKNFKIVLIPDIHNPPKWVDHVVSIIPDFDIIISNNSFTKQLFVEKGFKVKQTPLYNKEKYSGKIIRKRIIEGKSWKNLVPQDVYDITVKIDGEKRLKKITKNSN
jgi:nicotinamide-nucleotide adenylyltransferase